jgi:hypothetical protein
MATFKLLFKKFVSLSKKYNLKFEVNHKF